MAWAVRGRSSAVFGPSVWHGNRDRKEIALTFDDGPSPATAVLLDLLAKHNVPATFFQCGMHVRRYPQVVKAMVAAGHELGNHTDSHPALWLKSSEFIYQELRRTQEAIGDVAGVTPKLFRATYGVRWFGLAEAQKRLGLLNVMWTTIALDWKSSPPDVASRLLRGARNGAIFCLHDARERDPDPDIRVSVDSVKRVVPVLLDKGYEFRTVSDLLR
ncbi:MAG TPA: polysaccharide deacetylase family protein [Bryobacteraceae bacterium]|nr:polysaccharide deacetylase family protein [Bryobacteraceae bacterium]